MPRPSPRACTLAALLVGLALSPQVGVGAPPPEGASFSGRVGQGGEERFPLPAAPRGFWRVVLEGDVAGVDLDLRVEVAGKRVAGSRGEEASEEVLVPASEDLAAIVDHHDGPASGFTLRCEPVAAGKRLGPGKQVEGRGDADGAPWAIHELPPASARFHLLTLEAPGAAEGVDLDLHVYDAAWKELARSTEEACDEQVVLSPSRAARWVVVRAWAGATSYTLSATPLGDDARRLGTAEALRSTLEPDGERYFRLRTSQAGIVTVRLEGPADQDFDLQVFGPDGYYRESVAADAMEELAVNGARRGEYLVRVYAGGEGAGGDFTLATERLDVSKLQANGRGGSKVWGLFVGIASYEEVDDLTYTCGDALSIYQQLCATGQGDRRRSIVLLDELARRQDVVGALEEIARRADDDDVFVFFYSGHGGNDAPDGARGDPKDEADGGDEYLVCYDSSSSGTAGDLIDDDLRALLDAIPCRQQVLLLDACHAGGFAELIDREGRYGCFSSLESQTSTEALSLKKGLLTAIIIRALDGEADADGDGKVTLAELGAFVERVQPNTCPSCQAELAPAHDRCRGCGADLAGPDARQVPVIVDRLGGDLILSEPGRRRRVARRGS